MFLLKSTTLLALVQFIALSCSINVNNSPINCDIQRRCSDIEDIVWATDCKQCFLFRNACLFANAMCQRRDNKEKELEVVTQAECKKYCQDFCTLIYKPVCAEYKNTYKTFPNKCDFYRQSCQNSQSNILVSEGECSQH